MLILGGPGSGKGTQCSRLLQKYGVVHISTGDLFRAEVREGTTLGKELQSYMERGALVPDELGSTILSERLQNKDCQERGWLGDGWTRERANSESMLQLGIRPRLVLNLEVPRAVLVARLSGRRQDSVTKKIYHTLYNMPTDPEIRSRLIQRADDAPEAIESRLDTYDKQKEEALAPLREGGIRVINIDGNGTVDEVFARIEAVWDSQYYA